MPLDIVNDPLSIMPHLSHLRRGTVKDITQCLPVSGNLSVPGPLTALAPLYYNAPQGRGGPPVPRPFIGGTLTGFHAMPNQGDDFMTLYEPKFKPVGMVSIAVDPTKLDLLKLGESYQRHKDGRIADYLKADGSSTLYQDTGRAVSIGVSTGAILTLTAPNIHLVGILGVTGAATFSSTLGVTGAATLSSTLGVTGASVLAGGLSTTNTSITGTLGVSGLVTLASTLGVSGNLGVSGDLTETGYTTLYHELSLYSQSVVSTASITGTDTAGDTCFINFPASLTILVNGSSYKIPLL